MPADDSILAGDERRMSVGQDVRRERPAGRSPGQQELSARIHRHQSALSPLLVGGLLLAAWSVAVALDAQLIVPGGAHAWAWAVTLLAIAYGWICRRGSGPESKSGLMTSILLLGVLAVMGTGIAMAEVEPPGPGSRSLALVLLGAAIACTPALILRLELFVASVMALVLPLVFARLGGSGVDLPLAGLVLGVAAILCLGGMSLGARFRQALQNDVEQRILLKRLEQTNQALSADRVALQTESRTDPLTGLANRRYLEETLQAEWNRCRRSGASLSCVMLDIDHFKGYNDHYGHDGGDACLRRIAAILSDSTRRAGDVVARYGGEEFVVLLPETGTEGATIVAEFLKRAIAEAGIPHAKSPLEPIVTVSQGIATVVPDRQKVPAELLKAADLALYEAKGAGRNRVIMADDETHESARMAARGLIG